MVKPCVTVTKEVINRKRVTFGADEGWNVMVYGRQHEVESQECKKVQIEEKQECHWTEKQW